MRILFTLLASILVMNLQAQQAPNSGMETWTTGSFSNPEFWDTPNQETTSIPFVGAAVVTKSTGAHSGSWCAKLESKNFILVSVPGLMTLADFNVNTSTMEFSLTGGTPFTGRPEKFTGYYKYSPQGGDTCAIGAIFYKHNPGGWQDTIGIAFFLESNTVSSWTKFEAYVDWFTSEDPDTMNILASTAMGLETTAGSTLYIDDLEFDYSTGVTQAIFQDDAGIYYNGVTQTLVVSSAQSATGDLAIYNAAGSLIFSQYLSGTGDHEIRLGKMNPGIYLVRFNSNNEVITRKILL